MTDNTEIVQADTDDLNAFETLMFGQTKHEEEPLAAEEEVKETEPVVEEVEPEDTEGEDDEGKERDEEDSEPDPEDKPKKSRFQERIDKLTNERKEAERRADELLAKLEETLAKLEGKKEEPKEPAPKAAAPEINGPTPDDIDEDGEPKYPLGEFDPAFIRDLTRHTMRIEREAIEKEAAAKAEQQKIAAQQAELVNQWSVKLEEAVENKYPDIREKAAELEDTFANIEPSYGEMLVTEIMSMDNGPDVLYHLATNLDEAKKIVDAGPVRALRMLGTIEARYALLQEEKSEKKLKVSKAPEPPSRLNKGTSVAKDVAADTDDLDEFERLMFGRKR